MSDCVHFQLDKTNEMQNMFYRTWMPAVFQGLQDLDANRIRCVRNYMKQSAEVEKSVYPIINKCLDGILRASSEIDENVV
jgi:hypothetical protein